MAFLDEFLKCRPDYTFPTQESINKVKVWCNILQIIYNSNNWLDCDDSEFKSKVNENGPLSELLKYIWKRSTGGQCGLDFDKTNFPKINNDDLSYQENDEVIYANAVYLTSNDYSREAKKWGVINITPINYINFENLFKDNGVAVKKDEDFNWETLAKKAHHNFNSLVIVDNYILDNRDNNLIVFLENILPDESSNEIFLTIFTNIEPTEPAKKSIIDSLKKKKPKLRKITVEVINSCQGGKPFHDRTIISNNIWIGSGAGYDLLHYNKSQRRNLSSKDTTMTVLYPFLNGSSNDWVDKAYLDLINTAKKYLNNTNQTSKNYLLKI